MTQKALYHRAAQDALGDQAFIMPIPRLTDKLPLRSKNYADSPHGLEMLRYSAGFFKQISWNLWW